MRLQLLSDLHLESEDFRPEPALGADLLVLAGDIDATWVGLDHFARWPVPVLMVAGNHEFDGRELGEAWAALRCACTERGIRLLEREAWVTTAPSGRRVRFVGTVRWSDYDLFGDEGRERAMRAAAWYLRVMNARRGDAPLDPPALREEALACRSWLAEALAQPSPGGADGWAQTVAITHFGPSLRSADPRYGRQPGTASFCNADDALLPGADVWLHGHLHCRHDYQVPRPGRAPVRVVCQARGLVGKGEAHGFDAAKLIVLPEPG